MVAPSGRHHGTAAGLPWEEGAESAVVLHPRREQRGAAGLWAHWGRWQSLGVKPAASDLGLGPAPPPAA